MVNAVNCAVAMETSDLETGPVSAALRRLRQEDPRFKASLATKAECASCYLMNPLQVIDVLALGRG
jgi:hypothetical protein